MQTIVVGRLTRSLRLSRSSDRAVHHAGGAASLLFLEQAFNPRNTQMNTNGKKFPLYFAKLSECDTSSYRFGPPRGAGQKAVRGRPALQKHFVRNLARFVLIRVIRGQQNLPGAV
jgi:hypothetical protein